MCPFYGIIHPCVWLKSFIQSFNLHSCQPNSGLRCVFPDSEKQLTKIQDMVISTSLWNIHKHAALSKYNIRIIRRWTTHKTHGAQNATQSI